MIRIGYILLFAALLITSCTEESASEKRAYGTTDVSITNISDTKPTNDLYLEQEKIDLSIGEMKLNPKQYVNWINNQALNSLTKKKEISEINYQLKHLPAEYMVSNELKKVQVSKEELDSLIPQYDGMEYYELRISVDDFYEETAKYGVYDLAEYQQRIAYMSFGMQNDLSLKVNGDKEIPCELFHFERTYGIAPYATFLFGFSKEEMGDDVAERTVILNDNLFNKGLVKFYWQTVEIENVPKIQVL